MKLGLFLFAIVGTYIFLNVKIETKYSNSFGNNTKEFVGSFDGGEMVTNFFNNAFGK